MVHLFGGGFSQSGENFYFLSILDGLNACFVFGSAGFSDFIVCSLVAINFCHET